MSLQCASKLFHVFTTPDKRRQEFDTAQLKPAPRGEALDVLESACVGDGSILEDLCHETEQVKFR